MVSVAGPVSPRPRSETNGAHRRSSSGSVSARHNFSGGCRRSRTNTSVYRSSATSQSTVASGPGSKLWSMDSLQTVEMTLEGVKMLCPQATVRREPLVQRLQGTRLDPIDALLGGDPAGYEAGFTQHLQ